MARSGFRRGGFGGRRSFSGRSRGAFGGGRGRSIPRSNGSPRTRSTKTGQGRVFTYSLYDSRGKRVYVGSTSNPERRAAQHVKSGKLKRGGKLVVESEPMSRNTAERLEAKKIAGYRRRTGRLPAHNKTSDGRYHQRSGAS